LSVVRTEVDEEDRVTFESHNPATGELVGTYPEHDETLAARMGFTSISRSRKEGARVLTGGKIPAGPGNFYPPTVLIDFPPKAPTAKEEFFRRRPLFRPVLFDAA
jgi:acyl-CoA reductase-like NAD-dependent aldehyde dehydrogenase